MNESTESSGEIFKKSDLESELQQGRVPPDNSEDEKGEIESSMKALPNRSNFNISMQKMLRSLMKSRNTLGKDQIDFGQASFLGTPIQILGGDRLKINENFYELTPERHKALSSTGYDGENMKEPSDFLIPYKIKNYIRFTGIRDKTFKRKNLFTRTLPNWLKLFKTKLLEKLETNLMTCKVSE